MEKTSKLKSLLGGKSVILFVILVVVVAIFQIINKNYLSGTNILGILSTSTTSGTIVIGMACLLISGNIDLSAGATGMLGGMIVAFLLQAGVPWFAAVLLGLVFGMCIGLINSFFANVLNFMPFISTLAIMYVFQGMGNALNNAQSVAISDPAFKMIGLTLDKLFNLPAEATGFFADVLRTIPIPFAIMTILFIVYAYILDNTRFGRRVYMCGGNRQAARLAGINPKRISTILFMNNSAIAVLAGIFVAARMNMASPTNVLGMELTGITAAVLGGVSFMGGGGGMGGAYIGLLLLNGFTNGLQIAGLGAYWQIVANGVLLIAALMLDYFREKARIRRLKASMVGK